MQFNFKKNTKLKGVQILTLGFLAVIFVGATILTLPISSASGKATNFLDAMFTSTSAVCVTGLVTLDTGTHWSVFGQTVIMLLIEIGALGFMISIPENHVALRPWMNGIFLIFKGFSSDFEYILIQNLLKSNLLFLNRN